MEVKWNLNQIAKNHLKRSPSCNLSFHFLIIILELCEYLTGRHLNIISRILMKMVVGMAFCWNTRSTAVEFKSLEHTTAPPCMAPAAAAGRWFDLTWPLLSSNTQYQSLIDLFWTINRVVQMDRQILIFSDLRHRHSGRKYNWLAASLLPSSYQAPARNFQSLFGLWNPSERICTGVLSLLKEHLCLHGLG